MHCFAKWQKIDHCAPLPAGKIRQKCDFGKFIFCDFCFYKKVTLTNFANFLCLQMYFWGWVYPTVHERAPWKEVLAGVAPSSQTRNLTVPPAPGWQKFGKKWFWQIHFSGKMRLTTFHRTHLVKSKIWQTLYTGLTPSSQT